MSTPHNLMSALFVLVAVGLPASAQTTPTASAPSAPQVAAACAAPQTLNGTWRGTDGSSYAFRQVGSQVWALGRSPNGGQAWTNGFRGGRVGDTVSGTWADVTGERRSGGTLTLRSVAGVRDLTQLTSVPAAGTGSPARWLFVCNDVPNAPQP